jgi:hypothetical protein
MTAFQHPINARSVDAERLRGFLPGVPLELGCLGRAGSGGVSSHFSFVCWRQLVQQVRPVPSDNAAYFVIDDTDDLKAFLDLPADQFKLFRAEGVTV